MKNFFRYLLALFLIANIIGFVPVAYAGFPHEVTFHTTNGNNHFEFTQASETIGGTPIGYTYRGEDIKKSGFFIKYLIGWSDCADYATNDNALFFYNHEPVSAIEQKGIKDLYSVFISRLDIMKYIDNNEAYINKDQNDALIVPGSTISAEDAVPNDHNITLNYDESKSKYIIKSQCEFVFNKMLSHWLYVGNCDNIMMDGGSSANGADYTYVDLNVRISDEIELPSSLSISFTSYNFQPYMVIDTDTGAILKDRNEIIPLVSNNNPTTTFTVSNPTRKITLKTILRTNNYYFGKFIPNISAEKVQKTNMTLVLNSDLYIPKAKAKEMLDNNSEATITGIINGSVRYPYRFNIAIPDIQAKTPIIIRFKEAQPQPTKILKIDSPQTGDNENLILYGALIVAVLAIAGIVIYKKKKDNK